MGGAEEYCEGFVKIVMSLLPRLADGFCLRFHISFPPFLPFPHPASPAIFVARDLPMATNTGKTVHSVTALLGYTMTKEDTHIIILFGVRQLCLTVLSFSFDSLSLSAGDIPPPSLVRRALSLQLLSRSWGEFPAWYGVLA